MLKVSLLEFVLRGIPESILFILAAYTFSKKEIETKRFVASSIMFALSTYLIRQLPIHQGVNNILTLITLTILTINVNKISLRKAILVDIIIMTVQFLSEVVNILILQYILKVDVAYIFNIPMLKIVYGIPSLIILGVVIILTNKYNKRKSLKGVSC